MSFSESDSSSGDDDDYVCITGKSLTSSKKNQGHEVSNTLQGLGLLHEASNTLQTPNTLQMPNGKPVRGTNAFTTPDVIILVGDTLYHRKYGTVLCAKVLSRSKVAVEYKDAKGIMRETNCQIRCLSSTPFPQNIMSPMPKPLDSDNEQNQGWTPSEGERKQDSVNTLTEKTIRPSKRTLHVSQSVTSVDRRRTTVVEANSHNDVAKAQPVVQQNSKRPKRSRGFDSFRKFTFEKLKEEGYDSNYMSEAGRRWRELTETEKDNWGEKAEEYGSQIFSKPQNQRRNDKSSANSQVVHTHKKPNMQPCQQDSQQYGSNTSANIPSYNTSSRQQPIHQQHLQERDSFRMVPYQPGSNGRHQNAYEYPQFERDNVSGDNLDLTKSSQTNFYCIFNGCYPVVKDAIFCRFCGKKQK